MRRIQLGPIVLRDEPVARDRNAVDHAFRGSPVVLPLLEVDRARERRQQDELRERDVRAFREATVASNVSAVARQPEDERAEDVDAVLAERPQPLDQFLAARLKPL